MRDVYNFSAGPAVLPESVLQEAAEEMLDYKILFLQGGTSLQFAMIPMNFMRNRKADYILTGYWAKQVCKVFN